MYPVPSKLLWPPPEHLHIDSSSDNVSSQNGDIYSFAIIMQEIFMEKHPYDGCDDQLEACDIVDRVRQRLIQPFRTSLPCDACPQQWQNLICKCWDDNPVIRPSFEQILSHLRFLNNGHIINLADTMITRLESYTKQIEDQEDVIDKTQELMCEKNKIELILSELLPYNIAIELQIGNQVQPEEFENVTVFLSDIVGFTAFSTDSSPLDILSMLNKMYTAFDVYTCLVCTRLLPLVMPTWWPVGCPLEMETSMQLRYASCHCHFFN